MWHLKFSKRDFVEFWLGSNKKILKEARRSAFVEPGSDDEVVHAYWGQEPSAEYFFPSVIVASDSALAFLFTAVNASPTASTPVSAFSRVVASSSAESYFLKSQMPLSACPVAAIVALSMAEAAMHSDGRLGLKQLSSAACKRTLAYACGKAVTAKTGLRGFDGIIGRWLDAYALINTPTPSEGLRTIVSAAAGALETYVALSNGLPPISDAGNLAYVLHTGGRKSLEDFWQSLSRVYKIHISLDALSQSTREERGMYLQQALNLASSSSSDETLAAICAFIATQVAPGSLEHLELLKESGSPAIVFWYALFAGIQSPNEIMAGLGGLGYKVYRDVVAVEEPLSPPSSDICYEELKALERSGISGLTKKFGQVGVVEVELLPTVVSSFSYGAKQVSASRYENSYASTKERDRYPPPGISALDKQKLEHAIYLLSQLASGDSDGGDDIFGASSSKKPPRRRT